MQWSQEHPQKQSKQPWEGDKVECRVEHRDMGMRVMMWERMKQEVARGEVEWRGMNRGMGTRSRVGGSAGEGRMECYKCGASEHKADECRGEPEVWSEGNRKGEKERGEEGLRGCSAMGVACGAT